MDFITHTLAGVSTARLFGNQDREIRAIGLTVILASLLPDMDVWVYWLDPELFGKYHRTITHSIMGMIVIAFIAGTVSWWVSQRDWLKFIPISGFIPGAGDIAELPPLQWHRCLLFSLWATSLHFYLDWVTGWGIAPLWPLSNEDLSLHAVTSFDWFIFLSTLGFWAILHLVFGSGSPQAHRLSFARVTGGVYFLLITARVMYRSLSGIHTIW